MKLTFKHALAAILLMLSFAAPVAAGPIEDADAAYGNGNYPLALQLSRPLAEKGNVLAQTNLGLMYFYGQGVPQDYSEAVKWFTRTGPTAYTFSLAAHV